MGRRLGRDVRRVKEEEVLLMTHPFWLPHEGDALRSFPPLTLKASMSSFLNGNQNSYCPRRPPRNVLYAPLKHIILLLLLTSPALEREHVEHEVMLSGESRFRLWLMDRRVKVWRRCRERLANCCINSKTIWWRQFDSVEWHLPH